MLGRDVAHHEDTAGTLEAITNVVVQAVHGAEFASITRVTGQHCATVAPTDPAAMATDALQYKSVPARAWMPSTKTP